jgi:hypothetical protein
MLLTALQTKFFTSVCEHLKLLDEVKTMNNAELGNPCTVYLVNPPPITIWAQTYLKRLYQHHTRWCVTAYCWVLASQFIYTTINPFVLSSYRTRYYGNFISVNQNLTANSSITPSPDENLYWVQNTLKSGQTTKCRYTTKWQSVNT